MPVVEDQGPIHQAIQETLDQGELVIKWVMVAEVEYGGDGARMLVHRSGNVNGEPVYVWDAVGLLRSGAANAESNVVSMSVAHEQAQLDEEEEREEDERESD